MDTALDLYGFDKWLRKNMSVQTRKDYISKLEALKRRGIKEDTAPTTIFNTVADLCSDSKSNSLARMYEYAILSYQDFVRETTGKRIHLVDGFTREKYARLYPRNMDINPPKKGLSLYKKTIPRCKNDSMRLAMMLELNSGVRVGEVTEIKPEDVIMRKNSKGEDTIWLNIAPNKTEYGRRIRVLREDGFFDADEIYRLMEAEMEKGLSWPTKQQIMAYMSKLDVKSDDVGGNSHDLRKYCARGLYRGERLRGKSKRAASETVKRQLGHKDKGYTVGETKGNGGYIGKVYTEDKGGKYKDDVDWRTP